MSGRMSFDYIIVGAGSAGCVLANRLSADRNVSVLLIEAGPEDNNSLIKIPAGMGRIYKPGPINWGYFSEPELQLKGRRMYTPRGKTLGGSSAINAMVYMRGHPDDYDGWASLGNRNWGWNDVLPFFIKSEDQERHDMPGHGRGGPQSVSDLQVDDEASHLFIAAAQSCGMLLNGDFNNGIQDGVGRPQVTMRHGQRVSTAHAYLHPIRTRSNLRVEVCALARRVIVENNRAVGIEFEQGGLIHIALARREVLLAGGVINSPQLLLLSGIGPASELQRIGLPVVHDLIGVGKNMQDHVYISSVSRINEPSLSLNRNLIPPRLLLQLLRYIFMRNGYLTLCPVQAYAFMRAMPNAMRPDIQIAFRPISAELDDSSHEYKVHDWPGISAAVCLLRPQSIGQLSLRSTNPNDSPLLQFNYLNAEVDQQCLIAGIKSVRRIFASQPLSQHIGDEYWPGSGAQTDEQLLEFIRNHLESLHHPVGTCKMGHDSMAVVDDRLCVHGIDSLRVIDASVIPVIPAGNINASIIMIAEKAADFIIRGDL